MTKKILMVLVFPAFLLLLFVGLIFSIIFLEGEGTGRKGL